MAHLPTAVTKRVGVLQLKSAFVGRECALAPRLGGGDVVYQATIRHVFVRALDLIPAAEPGPRVHTVSNRIQY
jgi:hypothetical protein